MPNDNPIQTLETITYQASRQEDGSASEPDRRVACFQGVCFYESTGKNSQMGGTWFPFFGLKGKNGSLEKPYYLENEFPSDVKQEIKKLLPPEYTSKNGMNIAAVPGRFGNLQMMLMSSRFGGGLWDTAEVKLLKNFLEKKYADFNLTCPQVKIEPSKQTIMFEQRAQVNTWLSLKAGVNPDKQLVGTLFPPFSMKEILLSNQERSIIRAAERNEVLAQAERNAKSPANFPPVLQRAPPPAPTRDVPIPTINFSDSIKQQFLANIAVLKNNLNDEKQTKEQGTDSRRSFLVAAPQLKGDHEKITHQLKKLIKISNELVGKNIITQDDIAKFEHDINKVEKKYAKSEKEKSWPVTKVDPIKKFIASSKEMVENLKRPAEKKDLKKSM